MEIQKFEAYKYRGPGLEKLDRKGFLEGIYSHFEEGNLFDYEISGTAYEPENEILYIYVDKKVGDKYSDGKVLKIDFSDVGIEIGQQPFDEENEEPGDFIPEINLDTPYAKKVKDFSNPLRKEYNILKKGTEKYNL